MLILEQDHPRMTKKEENFNTFLSLIVSYICATSFGFHISSIEIIKNYLNYNNKTHNDFYILASVIFLCPIFSVLSFSSIKIKKSDWFKIICLINIFSMIILFTTNFYVLFFIRMIIGIIIGFTTALIPNHIHILKSKKSGIWVSLFQVFILFGVFLGQVSTYFAIDQNSIVFIALLFSLFNLFGLICSFFIRTANTIKLFLEEKNIKDLLKEPRAKKSILLAILINFTQQMTGIRGLIVYSNLLLKNYNNPKFITFCIGAFSTCVSLFSSFFINIYDRKFILKISIIILIITHFLFLIGILPIFSLILFHFGYSIGIGPISWLLTSEIFPFEYQKAAASLCVCFHWISAFLVVAFFEYFFKIFKEKIFLWFIFILTVFIVCIVHWYDETKDRVSDFQ
ncbi:Major Facilitator Superfamily (MFS) [Pseudoloma neurophilia]|uniref:Major Facilitator Superfamily (MFS) n=1 Tax=Pseudoloma neurophilia TaxID=146866 RepID=A0A0R0M1Q9_9MICR|nr:Major Facilitator Superfamily (MFS) [Pseudoloma neurophilia]